MTTMVAKISQRSLGDPRKFVVNAPENENRWLSGTIIGVANGISKRTSPDGEKVHEGLRGVFEAIPADASNPSQQSSILYLPEGMAEHFLSQFRGENPPAAVQLAIEVFVIRAGNAQGYSWELNPLIADKDQSDPLEAVRAKVSQMKSGAPQQRQAAPAQSAKKK